MHAIATFIQSQLKLRVFLPLLLLALVTTWYGLFWSVDRFATLTGGLRFMDMQPWLTADQLFEQIGAYPDDAVSFYLGWSVFDFAWPLVTFTTMVFITAWLFGLLPHAWQKWLPRLVAAACLTVLMDWAENLGFVALLAGLPAEPAWLAQTTLALHALKLIFNLLFNLGFWTVLATAIFRWLRTRLAS